VADEYFTVSEKVEGKHSRAAAGAW
jgi:hypothetical protein